ncbi:MAG: TolC family protein [candidate division Zixibacteria bacterium]|nr:TolC family protein [candidate division Zixibacteria bacterium]
MKKGIFFTVWIMVFFWIGLLTQAQEVPKKVLTIDDCVQIALKNNFTARSAQENYKSARWELLGGWSGFLPSIDLSSGWSRGWIDNTYPSEDQYNFNLGLTQIIFNGGRNWATYNSKSAGKRSAWDDLKLAEKSVALSVKEGCYNLLKAQMLYEVQIDVVKKSIEQLNMAKARFDLGSASLSDYLKAKVQLGNDSLSLISYANNVKLTEASLNSLLGLDINTSLEIDAKLEYRKLEANLEDETRKALEKHPQIDKAKMGVNQAHSSLTIARSTNLPDISFSGSYNFSNSRFPESTTDWKNNDSWGIGINVRLNLFEGFLTTSNVRSAKAGLNLAKESLKQSKRDLELEIKQAYLSVKEAEQKIRLTDEALKSAEEDLKLTQEKYNLGAASILELLDANVSYKTAKSNQVQALYDYNLALAQFEKAIDK